MSFYVVVPARYASSRLPGKPLADLGGQPMVVRVAQRCARSGATRVLVATDDERVRDAVGDQCEVVMTRDDHPSGTDRLQEVAQRLGLADDDIVVNVQGDEPLIPPTVIDQVAENLAAHPECRMATLCEPIERGIDLFNPNVCKVVFDTDGRALYFSRAPIPWDREAFSKQPDPLSVVMEPGYWWRHIGIYAYRVGFLHQFVSWAPAAMEELESLEQLRALANGVPIHVAPARETVPGGVDTEMDLQRMRRHLQAEEDRR